MFGRLFSFLFYIIIAYFVWSLIKLIFNMGRSTAEFKHRVDEAGKNSSKRNQKSGRDVIELNRDQYKVE